MWCDALNQLTRLTVTSDSRTQVPIETLHFDTFCTVGPVPAQGHRCLSIPAGIVRELQVEGERDNPGKHTEDGKMLNGNMKRLAVLTFAVLIMTAGSLAQAGRSDGGGYWYDTVLAFDTDVFYVWFDGGRTARVVVNGDGDTDLDLYIYDAYGNLIAMDADDYGDYCIASWWPRWTGLFRIEVVNYGRVYNNYRIHTN